MTISTTLSLEYNRDKLITMGYRLAGIISASESPDSDQIAAGADILNMELDSLQAAGHTLRNANRTTLPMVIGTHEYTLGTGALDVLTSANGSIGMMIRTDGSEVPVRAISLFDWMEINDKTATGIPSMCYIEKKSPVKLEFWPVPDALYTFRYVEIGFLASAGDGSNTQDVSLTWQKYLQLAIARDLAVSAPLPIDRITLLGNMANAEMKRCIYNDRTQGPTIIYMAHSGRNW